MRGRRPRDELRGDPRARVVTGAAVAVWRRTEVGIEWLVLHRSHFGAEFAGDWAWGPPGGGCDGGESVEECARRELREETGLDADCIPTTCGEEAGRAIGADFILFHTEVPPDAEVVLSWEHDGYRWLPLDEARALCLPAYVGDQLACVATLLG
jgi:8-oxo-dGTP pyrophosphatase MutT (NUDIX family)